MSSEPTPRPPHGTSAQGQEREESTDPQVRAAHTWGALLMAASPFALLALLAALDRLFR